MARMILPPSEYYVVDPSYVMGDVYDDFVDEFIPIKNAKILRLMVGSTPLTANKKGTYSPKLLRGGLSEGDYKFLIITDFGGDGTYDGIIETQGKRPRKIHIPVDVGMVSLIPVKMVKEIGAKILGGPHPKVKFKNPAQIYLTRVSYGADKGMTSTVEVTDGFSKVYIDFRL